MFEIQVPDSSIFDVMNSLIPRSVEEAEQILADAVGLDLIALANEEFSRFWFALSFLHPELHPDDVDEWPEDLKPFGEEVWRRVADKLYPDDHLYPSAASRSGILCRLTPAHLGDHAPDDRFFGRPSPIDPSQYLGVGTCLAVDSEGIVVAVIENSTALDQLRPIDMRDLTFHVASKDENHDKLTQMP